MRRLLIVSFVLLASGASAADWWIQGFGAASWTLETKGTYGLDIDNGAISENGLKAPIAKPTTGFGGMIGASSADGGHMVGVLVDFIGGTESTDLALQDAELGRGTLETNTSAMQISFFMAGRSSFLSSDSGTFQGYFGAGVGIISPQGDVSITYRDREIVEDPPGSDIMVEKIVDKEEKVTSSGSTFVLDLFLMEEWHLSGKFGLAATLGFRAAPHKDVEVTSDTMTGSIRNQYTGPYLRVGLRYDI